MSERGDEVRECIAEWEAAEKAFDAATVAFRENPTGPEGARLKRAMDAAQALALHTLDVLRRTCIANFRIKVS